MCRRKNSSWGVRSWYKVLKIIRLLNYEHQRGEVLAQKMMEIELSKLNLKRRGKKRSALHRQRGSLYYLAGCFKLISWNISR